VQILAAGDKAFGNICLNQSAVLDFDGSVSLDRYIERFNLRQHEEQIRYYTSFRNLEDLEPAIKTIAASYRVFFTGSGDFHHVSYLLLKHLPLIKVQVVVFDNHPDNMLLFPGIHCGSWVYHASKLPNISNITVFGISSGDISGLNLPQNRLSVLRTGKVNYLCTGHVSWIAKQLSRGNIRDIDISQKSISEVLEQLIKNSPHPLYLSIDKDVLSKETVRTTWDQGKMTENMLFECIGKIADRTFAADITGDLSSYRYKSLVKRLLRRVDGCEQMPPDPRGELKKHTALNLKILSHLVNSYPSPTY
jgi:hypothetical protein